jgi:hypothetical protein
LDYAQLGNSEKKRKAAVDLPGYIQKVPEMQDDIVNAVYDLCEDVSAEVAIFFTGLISVSAEILGQIRVEGYKAIAAVSREDMGILKRNVDVLIQLLQCGEHRPFTSLSQEIHALEIQTIQRRSSTSGRGWSNIWKSILV